MKATTGLCRTVADFVLVEVVLLVRGAEVVLLVLLSVEDVLLVRGVVVLLERGVEDVLLTVVSKLVALVRVVAVVTIVDLVTVDILLDTVLIFGEDVLEVTLGLN